MLPAAVSKLTPCITTLLLVVLWGLLGASLDDIHSLYLNFTVKIQSGPRAPWCKVKGSVDEQLFLQYDTDNKATPLSNLGKDIRNTDLWTDLIDRMKYMGQELRNRLPHIQLEKPKMRGHPTLQAKMFCQRRNGHGVSAGWQFTINTQYSFFFYPMNGTWTVSHPEATGTMKEWEKDKELVKDIKKMSTEDCRYWLEQLLKHWKPMLGPTPMALDVIKPPYTNQLPNTTQISSQNLFIIVVVIILIIIAILVVILVWKFCPDEDVIAKKE